MDPIALPADLSALSADELATLIATVREHASAVLADDASATDLITSAQAAHRAVTAESARRAEIAQSEAARAELRSMLDTPLEPEVEDVEPDADDAEVIDPEPALTASRGRRSTIDAPGPNETVAGPTLFAAGDSGRPGQQLADWNAALSIVADRIAGYSSVPTGRGKVPIKPGSRAYALGDRGTRHNLVSIRREMPADLRSEHNDRDSDTRTLSRARDTRTLPGGSLVASFRHSFKQRGALTAAVGWCAPSETIYDLCVLGSRAGMLVLPEIQADRGGFWVPEAGGADFSTLYAALADNVITEYQVTQGVEKVCIEIDCPDHVDVRLDAAYICLTGSLLQRATYPEAVSTFAEQALIALDHRVNASTIARIVAGSTAVTIAPVADSDDAASAVLSAVELAITDIGAKHYTAPDGEMEVIMPVWFLPAIRAGLARRRGVMALDVSDAEIVDYFTVRKAVPQFVRGWQDAHTGVANGPGRATPITALPATGQFLVYPAGTWSKIVKPVINLDTVYDSTLLTSNQYTALFAEDGFNVIQSCPESRVYTVTLDVAGIVGCCPTA